MAEKSFVCLSNIDRFEFCKLNTEDGSFVIYNERKDLDSLKGFYHIDNEEFIALYGTDNGPFFYYKNKAYKLFPELTVTLTRNGDTNIFSIEEYSICIEYQDSKFLGFDVWSERKDVDLLYLIQQDYKSPDFYKKFTR